MYLLTKCAISNKETKIDDDVVTFPYFDAKPGDAEFICCEDIALRSEFEKWYLKERVVEKVRNFWTQQYHRARSFLILAENENFLIAKSKVENKVLLFFLNHVFSIEFTKDTWKTFGNLILTAEIGDIKTNKQNSLYWNVDDAKGNLFLQVKSIRKDSITIPMAEWQNLQDLLSANNSDLWE